MPKRLSLESEREVMRLLAKGHSKTEIVRLIGRSRHAVDNVVVRETRRALAPPKAWDPSSARLSMSEREEIRGGLERGESFTEIACLIGRAVSTVSREVAANSGRDNYGAVEAHCDAGRRARRPKTPS